jgi:chemotaxis protein histidine kinase CheA
MTAGLLDFFVLESSECVERIDFLLSRAGATMPDLEAFARNARELRGSATMVKANGIAEVASVLERIVRGMRDGSLPWTEAVRAAVISAVDDLKILIRGARSWGHDEQERADVRLRELNALAPAFRRRSSLTPITASGNARFLADETASVAAGLQQFADNPGQISVLAETLGRVRALRGVAALSDLPPLAEVIAAVDDAAKPIELGTGVAGEPQRQLFRSAAAVLREGSDAVHLGGRPNVDSPAVQAFTAAAAKFIEGTMDADYIVPVSTLLLDDPDRQAVDASSNPPSSPTERFRLEVVSQAEHLRRLVSDARRAVDPPSRQRIGYELRAAVRSIWRAAESFGEAAVGRTLHSLIEGAAGLDEKTLAAIDEAATILTASGSASIATRFESLATPARAATPVATPRIPTPPAPPAPVPSRAGAATSGAALHDLLGAGLQGLAGLDEETMSEPRDVEDEATVPIGDLLYRGQAALRRAAALGDAFKRSATPATPDALAELFDLLELAATE